MLRELKCAHETLLACIAELEQLTRDDVPDGETLARVRWKLSRASVQRRRLVDEACDLLMTNATLIESSRIAALREDNSETVAASSRHVGRWSMEQVLADWKGYREASAAMRRIMRARILQEQRALYPLLERAAA